MYNYVLDSPPSLSDCSQSASVGGAESDGAEDGEWEIRDGAPWDGRTASAINRSADLMFFWCIAFDCAAWKLGRSCSAQQHT